MTQPSTISIETSDPQDPQDHFSNPPVNLVVPETVVQLRDVVER